MMLQVRRLEKIVENRTILYIEELDVRAGDIVAVIGSPHSGKSLLIRLLAGEILASGGHIKINDQKLLKQRRYIGVLFDEDLLYERISVREHMALYADLYRQPRSRIDEVLALVGLNDQIRYSAQKLSPASRRRLAFARLLMQRPSFYLLDEPFLHTDVPTRDLFIRLFTQLAKDGAAILVTGEDMALFGRFCNRLIELQGGRIQAQRDLTQQISESPEENKENRVAQLIPFKVPARREDRIIFFDPGDILYATSRDGKTIICTENEEATSNLTLQELEQRLVGRGFFKAHRAYLVNLQHIKAVIQYTRNSYTLQLNDAQETMIPLSKQSEKELQALLAY